MLHRAICILLLICAWYSQPILAQDLNDIFTVEKLSVDVTAESALKAREIALLQGQREALQRVLTRITLRADHNRLPTPGDKTIEQMVATVAVAGEKTSTVRYLANLTVKFHRTSVRRLLKNFDIRFSETRAKPILVLPVFEKGAAQSLFENNNIWRDAWAKLNLNQDLLLPIRLPMGDLRDVTTITAHAALAGRIDLLQAIAERYEVKKILVAHANLDIDLSAGGLPKIVINLLHFSPSGTIFETTDHTVTISDDLEAAMDQLARSVVLEIQEQWKRRTQISFEKVNSLSAFLSLSRLSDWLTVRERLAATPMISSFELREISRQDAQVVIDYFGDAESLVVSLAQRDLRLTLMEEYWALRYEGVNTTVGKGAEK